MQKTTFSVRSIGTIDNEGGSFVIRINDEYREALKEAEGFSHLQIFWWCHMVDDEELRSLTVVPKPYKKGPDEVGLFATRSPVRPNPIAMTIVSVLSIDRDAGTIRIPYIDAEEGSSVIDIKPYHGIERVRKWSVPDWCSHWPGWYEETAGFDWEKEFENAQ